MKKSLLAFLFGLFLCAASPALAAEDVELGPDAFDLNKATVE